MAGLTFVLVHGAWHGGWCWSRVADHLRAASHRVFAPTCTGLGERAHLLSRDITLDTFIADVVGMVEAEELVDIVLVGHSFGGLTVSGVADRMPERIRHLVYLDAALAQPGACAFDALPPAIVTARREAAEASSNGLSLPCPPPSAFGVLGAADVAWLTRRLTPHPLSTFLSPLSIRNPLGNGVARTYVACTAPAYTPLDAVKTWVRTQPGWGWREMMAGHDAMITAPNPLARLLVELAGA